ncbi:MAG: hypothetical protein PHR35_10875 [Kiritimatiellae bacterium]|nr:hypothetical protein [Kiritimatiellia bacterium]
MRGKTVVSHMVADQGEVPQLVSRPPLARLRNAYWRVVHDARQGGCPTAITFRHGTRRHLLVEPLGAHVALRPGKQIVFYRQDLERRAELRVETLPSGPRVTFAGRLRNEKGTALPVRYEQTYQYEAWGIVRVRLTLVFEKALRDVCEIGVCNFQLTRDMDVIGLRPGVPPPPPSSDCYFDHESHPRWKELGATRSYKDSYRRSERMAPCWFSVFQKGVEGLEFWREDDGTAWDRPFGVAPGHGFFGDDSRKYRDRRHIRLEPFCAWANPAAFGRGRLQFNYVLGLPFVKPLREARKPVFHAGIHSRAWPEEETLRKWADSGVSLLRLHDDDSTKKPSWRDCFYPPYDRRHMRRMDRVIELAHRFGIKITPYFSLKEFHPDCPEYPANAHAWKRWVDEKGTILAERGPYGGYMCLRSGWMDFRKATIDLVLRNHAFDGVYYDHLWFRYCRHPDHAGGRWHTDAEEMLNLLCWTRQRVGPDGLIFIHTSGCPTMIGENLANLAFIGEDMAHACPLPDRHTPDLSFVPITPRNWVPANPAGKPRHPDHRMAVLTQFLEHCPTSMEPPGSGDFALSCARLSKKLDLQTYDYHPADRNPLGLATPGVYASFYARPDRAVIVCANLTKQTLPVGFRIPRRLLKWPDSARARLGIMGRAFSRLMSLNDLERKLNELPIPSQRAWVTVLKR